MSVFWLIVIFFGLSVIASLALGAFIKAGKGEGEERGDEWKREAE